MRLGVPQHELAHAPRRQGCHTGQAKRSERKNNQK
jgi:hypothetical protein